MLYSIGGIELDGEHSDIGRDSCDGNNEGSHMATNCYWYNAGHPELCDWCLLSIGITSDWHIPSGNSDYIRVQDNKESMEIQDMSELLGTAWWTLLCLVVGCGAGIYIYPWLKNRFNK